MSILHSKYEVKIALRKKLEHNRDPEAEHIYSPN